MIGLCLGHFGEELLHEHALAQRLPVELRHRLGAELALPLQLQHREAQGVQLVQAADGLVDLLLDFALLRQRGVHDLGQVGDRLQNDVLVVELQLLAELVYLQHQILLGRLLGLHYLLDRTQNVEKLRRNVRVVEQLKHLRQLFLVVQLRLVDLFQAEKNNF